MTLPQSLTSILGQMPRIPVDKIKENIVTLRSEYDMESLEELGDSMGNKGQLQPVIVQHGDGEWFDLVIGSRRLRAAKAKGQTDIAAFLINKQDPAQLLFIALAENLHRVDLNPFEEAQGFLRLAKEYGLSTKDIAKGVNKPESYIRNRLQLLSMPEEVATLVSERRLSVNMVPPLARLPTGGDQVRLARFAIKHHLSQTELVARVHQELEEPPQSDRATYEMTPVKLQARIGGFISFFQKVHRRMNIRRMNSAERQAVLLSLQKLEDEVRLLRESVRGIASSAAPIRSNLSNDGKEPDNHGEEWTQRDIRRINSVHRPSDEELARELGRTPGAIRAMRAQTKEKV